MSKKEDSTKKVFTSQCFIGGEIKKVDSGGEWVLVDVGKNSKWLFCDIYDDKDLSRRLACYSAGDHILIHGYVRAYSRKDENGEWEKESKTTIRITEIRSKDPETERNRRSKASEEFDDAIPF